MGFRLDGDRRLLSARLTTASGGTVERLKAV
jgi:hypothetical protein